MRNVLIEVCLALAAYKPRPGASDKREPARQSALANAHHALQQLRRGQEPADVPPESPLNLLLTALDYCDQAGVPHSEVIAAVNKHARTALPQRSPAASQEAHGNA